MTKDDNDDIFLANLQLSLNTANPWIEKTVFETMDRRFDLFTESMHRLETTQEKILAKLDLKEQLTETAAKTDQLEKRLDDLRSMFLRTTRSAEASHQA